MIGFISTIIIAIIIAWAAYAAVGNKILNGIWGAIPVGVLGAWIGGYMPAFKNFGPTIDNVALIPSAIGAAVLIVLLALFKNSISEMAS